MAFETANVELLTAVLRADATLELVPNRAWYAGKTSCSQVLASAVGNAGDWRMGRTIANGQPAVTAYLHGQPFGVAVLDVRRTPSPESPSSATRRLPKGSPRRRSKTRWPARLAGVVTLSTMWEPSVLPWTDAIAVLARALQDGRPWMPG